MKPKANTLFYACSRDEIKRPIYILAQLFEKYVCESRVYKEKGESLGTRLYKLPLKLENPFCVSKHHFWSCSCTLLDGLRLAPSLLKPLFKLFSPNLGYSTIPATGGESIKFSYSATDNSKEPIVTEVSKEASNDKKPARRSKDSVIRWAAFVVYLIVTTPLIVTMVILAITTPIDG